MKREIFIFLSAVFLITACKINVPGISTDDDDDDKSPCPAACDKVDECDLLDTYFDDRDDCLDYCEEGRAESEDGEFEEAVSCIMNSSCEAVEYCIPEDDGCCSASDPCDWANDGVCDCNGDYSWDDADCEYASDDDDDTSSSSDPCSDCLSTCSGLSSCCTGCGCICEDACNMCF